MRTHARIVVVGGGCVGASIIYALTKHGCNDVVMLERTTLTSGSTWHAAGLLGTYGRSYNHARMSQETLKIYKEVEKEAGTEVGLHICGTLRIANSPERMDEYLSNIGIVPFSENEAHILNPQEIQDLYPLLDPNPNIRGGIYHPNDGHIAPSDITMAMAKLARDKGAKIEQNCEAIEYEQLADGGWKIRTSKGDITCEHLVFATGNYARENALKVGLDIPAIPVAHQYWTTMPVPQLLERKKQGLPELPVLRDEDFGAYLREDANAYQFGPYESMDKLKLFAVDGVPKDFGADLLPEDFEAVEENWEAAIERVPALGEVGIKSNTRGPFQMTPDDVPLCGPAWGGHRNLWLAEGMPGGILWGGTCGDHLAQWILTGEPGIDMSECDPRRFGTYVNKTWTKEKLVETWGTHMILHVPGEDRTACRPAKTTPSYDLLTSKGAVWSALNGWENAAWYAPAPELAIPEFSFRRTEKMKYIEQEVYSVRNGAGLMEISPMTKHLVTGSGAADWLNSILANKLPKVGRMNLSVLCTDKGCVKCEFTVIREAEHAFYLVSTPSREIYTHDELSRLLPDDGSVALTDVSEKTGIVTIAGPKSRDILSQLTETDLSNEAFPWLSARTGDIGYANNVRMLRVNYAGELGWELHHPMSYHRHVVSELLRVGEPMGMKLFGLDALESMRVEKSYRGIRTEINTEITALEAGFARFINFDKPAFPGRNALLAEKENGPERKIVTLMLDAFETSAFGHETVYHDGKVVGRITSTAYSYTFKKDIMMAIMPSELSKPGTQVEVTVHGEQRKGEIVTDSPYDPSNSRSRM